MVDKDCKFLCKARSWLRDWLIKRGFLFVLVIGLIIFVGLFFWPNLEIPIFGYNNNENPQSLYLLSAVAQSLAAVFALVFTITLIVAQLTSKYSHRILGTYFDTFTIAYIFFFILVILFPIFLLAFAKPKPIFVEISLFLSSLCLLFLIPYFLSFRDKLNPIFSIQRLERTAEKQVESGSHDVSDTITTIFNFIMSAFVLKDYDTFKDGIKTLGRIALKVDLHKKIGNSGPKRGAIEDLLSKLRDACIIVLDDPIAPRYIISELSSIGMHGAIRNSEDLVSTSVDALGRISVIAIDRKAGNVLAKISSDLNSIASQAIKNIKGEELSDAVTEYSNIQFGIFRYSVLEQQSDLARRTVTNLSVLGEKAIESDLSKISSLIIELIGEMGVTLFDKVDLDIARFTKFNLLKNMKSKAAGLFLTEVERQISRNMEKIPVTEN